MQSGARLGIYLPMHNNDIDTEGYQWSWTDLGLPLFILILILMVILNA